MRDLKDDNVLIRRKGTNLEIAICDLDLVGKKNE
jgi:hypothetical protein